MTSRQRLLSALNREPTDRVPVSTYELVGWNSHSFENREPSYASLMDLIREKTDCVAMWNPPSNERFLCSSHPIEMDSERSREGNTTTIRNVLHTPKGDLTQTLQILDNVNTVWQVEHWCKSLEDVDKALSVPFEPVTHTTNDLDRIQEEVGDRGIVMSSTGDALIHAAELMEMGEFTVWAMTETEHFARTVAILHERNQIAVRSMLETAPVDLYRICGPEYATPPYLPPSLFERFVQPYVKEQADLIHSFGSKVRMHSHGKIGRVLDCIAATDVDALDPIEAPPDGDVELAEVKRRLGDRMCLFGNIQLKLLEAGTPEQVRAEVRKDMDSAKAGGGYVIMPTAAPINIPLSPDTERNYREYIEAALEYGAY
jgi:uroporphyrinogen-III decarboxylase